MGAVRRDQGVWTRFLVTPRAIVVGSLVGLVAANVWLPLLYVLGVPTAAAVEVVFLSGYIWWAAGGGPPRSLKAVRAESFRMRSLSGAQWRWGLVAAVSFAVSVHGAIVVLFRFVPFPAQAFHAGYDLSVIPTAPVRWLTVVVSAASAGICEETGFRGYMQQPIERRHGPLVGILISSLLFMLVHLNKSWSVIEMVPIVFGAGILLGTLAWASQSLIFGMISHTLMDVGLFAFWWSQIAGTFAQRPISETGIDPAFFLEVAVFAVALLFTLSAIARLRRLSQGA